MYGTAYGNNFSDISFKNFGKEEEEKKLLSWVVLTHTVKTKKCCGVEY